MLFQVPLESLSPTFAWRCLFAGLTIFSLATTPLRAASEPTPEQVKFFETSVRPLLVEHCLKCHSEEKQKGELRLDSRGHMLLGGESGPAIVPGKPDESLLMEAVRYESFEMPPAGKLDDKQIEILAKWIEIGAPWPGDNGQMAKRTSGDQFSEEDRNWWAFQPIKKVDVPTCSKPDWCRNEIDQFIAAGLDAQQLTPAPEADRRTLIRRLYFDLTGLPPTPEEVQKFVDDAAPQAYEHLVDRLLASPDYGERWARHWLDLVRYADSDGYRIDHYRPQAWRYRDYVIQSLNDDKPYDRFVQEQLAGDELFPGDVQALTATGFLRHGIYEYNARDVRGQWDVILNEVTDVTGDVFFGLGFQCARCHDHKFDPILQKDYFALRAFFEPILLKDDVVAATPEQCTEYQAKLAEYEAQTLAVRTELDALEAKFRNEGEKTAVERFPDDIKAMIYKQPSERTPFEEQLVQLCWRQVLYEYERIDDRIKGEDKEKILALRRQLAALPAKKPESLPQPLTARDVSNVAPSTVIPKKKTEVGPGFLTLIEPNTPEIVPPTDVPNSTGRRSALARWLTRPDNALSTRVIVNRVWQYHFGRGLAVNSSDFGRLGTPPTHPELLDWLTTKFVNEGWRFKSLHRLIVTSAAYRQSTSHPQLAENQIKDPLNTWYWRAETRRLDAEQIRDAIFAVTGQLDRERGGPGVLPDRPRRSIYARVMRNSRDPLLDAFDLPQFFSSTASRDTTTSPIQSLLLINSQTMLRHASELARRVKAGDGDSGDVTPQIEQLWRLSFSREPTSEELLAVQNFLKEQSRQIGGGEETSKFVPNIVTGKVPYRDGQAILFQPEGDQGRFAVANDPRLEMGDFTVEAFFQLRSVYDTGSVRTLAAKWSGNREKPGWAFGITGKGSRRKPQTLVMQMFGNTLAGSFTEATTFSDQNIEMNKPYYAAACVRLAKTGQPGAVRYFLKDLSNDDEPLQSVEVPLAIATGIENPEPLTLGTRGTRDGRFDGLIDDIRVSRGPLSQGQLLFTNETAAPATVGYWQFEPDPGVFQNAVADGLNIHPVQHDKQQADPQSAAFVDLCHVLLNSSEFLYVD
ncbi:Planctomycete cytochrome C [Planctomicrobium piriforme]|uniref:Planctomycete cytochrome C n=2 Tax=Planctomicrobium piriforme TaxID=1576369 RepID=A0A1I3GZE9_9PLAN|nr:Planctomycete cytochrome C [Planctomicrobium piriforme]